MTAPLSRVGFLTSRAASLILGNLVFALSYLGSGMLGLFLIDMAHPVAAFWPTAGLAVAAMLSRRFSLWPGLGVGAFVLTLTFLHSVAAALGTAAASMLVGWTGAFIYRRLHKVLMMEPFTDVVTWLAVACLAPVIPALLGASTLWETGLLAGSKFWPVVMTWWAGDAIGILAVGPLICSSQWWKGNWRIRPLMLLKGFLLATAGVVVCYFVFYMPEGSLFLFLTFPLLLLATLGFGGQGARWGALGIIIFITLAARNGQTPFAISGQSGPFLQFEAFLLMVALTAQMLAALEKAGSLRLPGLVLLIGWAVGGWLFSVLQSERMRLDAFQLDALISECQAAIKARMETYVNALQAGASLFEASEFVEREEWKRFTESLDLADRYPGIHGLGVIFPLKESDKEKYLAQYSLGRELSIRPLPGAGSVLPDPAGWKYFVITYLEPEATNLAAIGLDIASEAKRQHAARVARDYGIPQISGRITLIQDHDKRAGFILFVPMYLPGREHDTVHSRRTNFRGWIFAPFIFESFLNGVLGNLEIEVSLQLFEGLSTEPSERIFHSGHDTGQPFVRTTVLQLGGRQFTCGWTPGPDFKTAVRDPLWNAGILALIPILLAGLVTTLQVSGRRATELVDERTHELKEVNERLEVEILERKAAEQSALNARATAETANKAKSEFLATMSHEIRTPMNGVIGYTDLLVDSKLSDEQRGWANNIQSSGRTLLAIINDILDFSKIEAGKLELEHIVFDPLAAVREVIDLSDGLATQKNLPLYLERPTALPTQIVGDPTRFKQILLNLVSNAIKFTESGAIRIRLEWASDPDRLQVSVSDTGLGIPEDKRDQLFQRFSQVDSSTTRRYGGTGLGLAICRHLVELMAGTISVTSELGAGTIITFEIPCERPETHLADVPVEEGHSDTDERKIGAGRRVLLAEDVALNQKLATTLLKRLGCTVEIASNGQEAIDKASTHAYDIIYMDCQMPIKDGYEAAREIRLAETNSHVPIVALTANALEGDRDKCLTHGMDDYITKPFAKKDFIRTLLDWDISKSGNGSN